VRPADLTPLGRDALRGPARAGFIFASFLGAYILAVLPWSGGWLLARPDFVLLVLAYWSLYEPRVAGQGLAFALGLLMDVSDSMLLGQHAFTFVIAVFATQVLRVRILTFRLPEQTLHMAGIFATAAVVMLTLNLLLGAEFPGIAFLVSPLLTAIAWPPATWLLTHGSARRGRSEASI
jgi:rod shape-determining protein MreD